MARGSVLVERFGQFLRGVVEIGQMTVGIKLQDGVGTDLGKGGEFLDLRFGLPLRSVMSVRLPEVPRIVPSLFSVSVGRIFQPSRTLTFPW